MESLSGTSPAPRKPAEGATSPAPRIIEAPVIMPHHDEQKPPVLEAKPETSSPALSPVRTFKADAEEEIQRHGGSLTSMVLAERAKKMDHGPQPLEEATTPQKHGRLFLILGALIFVLAGGGILAFVLINVAAPQQTTTAPREDGSLFTESRREIPLVQENRREVETLLTTRINGAQLPINQIERLVITRKERVPAPEGEGAVEQQTSITVERFFAIMESEAPASLIRALDPAFVFGIHSFTGNNPFFILTVRSFPNAVSGMLAWEPALYDDMARVFNLPREEGVFTTSRFDDAVIKNHDVRIMRDGEGRTLLFYSFVDEKTLVVAGNEITFDELIKRLNRPRGNLR